MSNGEVLATVGGPTYLSEIAYNASNNAIYYLVNNYGGKGCPPIIHSINLANNQNTEVKTCDEVLQEYFKDYSEENNQKYRQFISDFYENLSHPYLGSVSLKKNKINVNVRALSEHVENGEKYWTEFRATITQDNKDVAKIDFRGCDKEQPHVFEGYKIPNSDAMVGLISNKSNCFEGGYTGEALYPIKNVKYYATGIVRGFKGSSATEPNLGNLTVYASSGEAEGGNNKPFTRSMMLVGVAVLVAILLGCFMAKRR